MSSFAKTRRRFVTTPLILLTILILIVLLYDKVPSFRKLIDDATDAMAAAARHQLANAGEAVREMGEAALDAAGAALDAAHDAAAALVRPLTRLPGQLRKAAEEFVSPDTSWGERGVIAIPLLLMTGLVALSPVSKLVKLYALLGLAAASATGVVVYSVTHGDDGPAAKPGEAQGGGDSGRGTGDGSGPGSGTGIIVPGADRSHSDAVPNKATATTTAPLGPNKLAPGMNEKTSTPEMICAAHGGVDFVRLELGPIATAPYICTRCKDGHTTTNGVFPASERQRYSVARTVP